MKISNIVATVELIKPFDISFLNKNIKGTVRDPKVHWLKYRIPYNNSYIAFYKSGKFVVNANSPFSSMAKDADAAISGTKIFF